MLNDKLVGQLRVLAVGTRNMLLIQYLNRAANALRKGYIAESYQQELVGALEQMKDLYDWRQAEILAEAVTALKQLDAFANCIQIEHVGWGKAEQV